MADINSAQTASVAGYQRLLAWETAMSRRLGFSRQQRYQRNWDYYSGENLPPDNTEMPLGINYVKTVHEKHTAALFGQWRNDIIRWRCKPLAVRHRPVTDDEQALCEAVEDFILAIQRANQGNVTLYDAALNASIYGDGVVKVFWDVYERRVKWQSVLPEFFHCRWHPADMSMLTEAIVAYNVDRADAFAQWGVYGNTEWAKGVMTPGYYEGMCVQWERWTPTALEVWIDDVIVEQKPNPYMQRDPATGLQRPGIIPFVHIPNMQAGSEFFGFADAEQVHLIQDELNRVMADMSDVVNNHAHPITLLNNFLGRPDELTVGPDQVWDLGKEGKAGYLSYGGPAPQVMDFLQTLKDTFQDAAALPDAAWGRSKQSQVSGVALAMAMLPVTDRATGKRLIWDTRLRQLLRKTVYIHTLMAGQAQMAPLPFSYEDVVAHDVSPQFAVVLPKDRLASVNENVSLVGAHIRDILAALEDLGEEAPDETRDRVVAEIKELAPYGVFGKPAATAGSPALPGSGQSPDEGPKAAA